MTRWARSGSSQKHKKPPEDPTPWEDFASQKKPEFNSKYRHSSQNVEASAQNTNVAENTSQNITANVPSLTNSISKSKKFPKKKFPFFSEGQLDVKTKNDGSSGAMSGHPEDSKSKESVKVQQIEKSESASNKKKKNKKRIANLQPAMDLDTETSVGEEITVTREEILKYKKQMKKKRKAEKSVRDHSQGKKEMKFDEEDTSSFHLKQPSETSLKELKVEKTKFLDRLKKKRADRGILLLPPKTEKRLYNMKKSLRDKGMPGENIREIVRGIRRKEELKFRKTLKTCFKCRKMGHVLANCPLLEGNTEEGTGICFKCGSTEHTSYRCSIKGAVFPFAKCFICQERGHLSRDCPKNKRGAYPKGGSCNECGSINHLKKDCPTLQNKGSDEEMTVGTLTSMTSVEEIEECNQTTSTNIKPRIVKF